jgi:hypothetical protein
VILKPTSSRALLLAAVLAAGCKYSFQNPAQDLSAGEIAGQPIDGAGQPAAGAGVSVKGSALDQASRASGWFGVPDLPPGHHVVLVRQGLARAALREVDLEYGADGRVDGAWLGSFPLPLAASLSGTLDDDNGTFPAEGLVVDETTGIAVNTGAVFTLDGLPIGPHRLFAGTRDAYTGALAVGGPVGVTIAAAEQGTEKALAPIPLRAASGAEGHLLFRVSSLVAGLDAAAADVRVTDAAGAGVSVPAPDSNGDRDVLLPEGLYFVEVRPPAAWAASVASPARAAAVVIADNQFDLGTFYLAEDSTLAAAARSCRTSADCAPGGTCVSGVCDLGYSPPAAAPATAPVCGDLAWCPDAPGPCDAPGAVGPATCLLNPASSFNVCIPCSTSCTPDGVTVLSAAACP